MIGLCSCRLLAGRAHDCRHMPLDISEGWIKQHGQNYHNDMRLPLHQTNQTVLS